MRARGLSVIMLVVVGASCGGDTQIPEAAPPTTGRSSPSGRLERPFPLEPFSAIDLDGRDVSSATWRGQVVVINVWATWCAPCRREIPALTALQHKYRDRVLVIGLLQDNVTDAFAREFGKSTKLDYSVVRSTSEIERRFPAILALPTTFVIDSQGRLAAMWAGEIDAAALEKEVTAAMIGPQGPRHQKSKGPGAEGPNGPSGPARPARSPGP